MRISATRRQLLAGGIAAATLPWRPAHAATELVGIDWGGPLIEATKKITEPFKEAEIAWDLHSGGAGTVLTKIKAAWPNPRYDIVACWNPVYVTMINEGWLEPLTFDKIPNLRDVPRDYIFTDKNGAMVNVPRSLAGMFWGYRSDTAPLKIEKVEQLFDPKLKGQICWPGPSINSNLQLLSLAITAGGNERNMEPGWELLKKLAKSGNIGRVAHTETDFLNAMSTGETSVAFWNMSPWKNLSKNFPVTVMTRAPVGAGFKAFLYQDGWVVLSSSKNKKAAMDYLNFFISPENNQAFNQMLGQGTTNRKSVASGFAENIAYKPDELEKFAYFPDFTVLASQLDASVKRFETEIVPLL
jgi:putative spermidine/putrescine transport system substrate-binding protein